MIRAPRVCALMSVVVAAVAALVTTSCSSITSDAELHGRITVKVKQRQGAPLDRVRLVLFRSARELDYVVTDSLGRAEFDAVPRGTSYGVFAILSDPVRGLSAIAAGQPEGNVVAPIAIDGGDESPVTITLLKLGTGVFEGDVKDNANLPLVNVEVFAYTPSGFIGSQRSDATGKVRFTNVPFGQFGAYAVVPESIGGPGIAPINRQGMFFDAGHLERRTFTITRCLGSITARVLDQANALVADYPVNLFTATGYVSVVRSNATGNALFGALGCGEYGVSAQPQSGFTVNNVRGQGFQDGLRVNLGSALTPTIRVVRTP